MQSGGFTQALTGNINEAINGFPIKKVCLQEGEAVKTFSVQRTLKLI